MSCPQWVAGLFLATPPPPTRVDFFVSKVPFSSNTSTHLPTSNQDRFRALLGPNLGPSWGQVGTQMGSKSVLRPLPTWTCIRCCFRSPLGPSWSRLCEVVGEAGGPCLAYPLMVLKDFLNDRVRSSRAPVSCPKGLLGLILGPFWDPCWGQVGVKMELLCMLILISNFDLCSEPSWAQHGPNLRPKRA